MHVLSYTLNEGMKNRKFIFTYDVANVSKTDV